MDKSLSTTARVPQLARAAVGLLAVFPLTVAVLAFVQRGHYDSLQNAMSELALGTGGGAMFIAFTCMGAGTVTTAWCLHKSVTRCRVAPVLLVAAGCLDVVSAIFHTNGEGQPDTTSSSVHLLAGILTFVLTVIAMAAATVAFRRDAGWRGFAFGSALWTAAAVGTFFLVPILGDERFGLAQRIFVATWLSWLIVVDLRIARGHSSPSPVRQPISVDTYAA